MTYLRPYLYVLLTAVSCVMTGTLLALPGDQDGSDYHEELNERDYEAVREFLKSKIKVDVSDKCSTLTISGDVRTEWRHLNETCCHQRLRGSGASNIFHRPISRNDFDVEFNLRFDYVFDRAWAVGQIRYDNPAGVDDNGHPCFSKNEDDDKGKACKECCVKKSFDCIGDPQGFHGSGRDNELHLRRAYMGYNLIADGDSRLDVELGRRGNLYNVFESNVQFLSRLDCLLFRYENVWKNFADWYIQAAGFVVDEKVNHFAWVAEVGFDNIFDSDFDIKYSIIDWEKNGKNRCFVENPIGFRFVNSQVTGIYHLKWKRFKTTQQKSMVHFCAITQQKKSRPKTSAGVKTLLGMQVSSLERSVKKVIGP